ncbi:MAG: hypothetical protein ACR2LZ_01430 [Pyrinomonadaceae bacterium]
MKKDEQMRHISRIDQFKKRQHGWWFRIHRDGKMIQRFFSDYAHGGNDERALREAKRYRDALLIMYPKPERGNMFNRPNSRNKGNPPGVHRTHSVKRGYYYDVWQAGWILPNGKRINRKFHFSSDGRTEEEARRLAIKARKEGVALIEKMMRDKQEKGRGNKKSAVKKKAAAKKKSRK